MLGLFLPVFHKLFGGSMEKQHQFTYNDVITCMFQINDSRNPGKSNTTLCVNSLFMHQADSNIISWRVFIPFIGNMFELRPWVAIIEDQQGCNIVRTATPFHTYRHRPYSLWNPWGCWERGWFAEAMGYVAIEAHTLGSWWANSNFSRVSIWGF